MLMMYVWVVLLWIKNFFSARTHQTKVGSFLSDTAALISSVVTKALDAETQTKTEAAGFKTEAKTEAVYLKTKAEAQGSWPILLTVLSSGAVLAQKF